MVFFPHEWITRADDVQEQVRVQLPDRPPPTEEGDDARGTGPPASPPVPSEPLAPAPAASHEAAPGA